MRSMVRYVVFIYSGRVRVCVWGGGFSSELLQVVSGWMQDCRFVLHMGHAIVNGICAMLYRISDKVPAKYVRLLTSWVNMLDLVNKP